MTDAGTGDDSDRDPPERGGPPEADDGPESSPDVASGPNSDDVPDSDGATGPGSDGAAASGPGADHVSTTPPQRDGASGEPAATGSTDGGPDPREEPLTYFLRSDDEGVAALRDILSTVAMVALVGLFLFAVSGIWPPLVAVESGSMEPHMETNDLVFIVDEGRFAGDGAVHGVVTHQRGQDTGVRSFGNDGEVIVFQPNGNDGVPIIHRAHIYVEEGENWVDRADRDHLRADTCEEVRNCPAPHDGFITKGDDTPYYDQVAGRTTVVKSDWVNGRAEVRIPWLGWVRLQFARL